MNNKPLPEQVQKGQSQKVIQKTSKETLLELLQINNKFIRESLSKAIKNFEEFKKQSDVIVVNKLSYDIRDIFNGNN
jgi:LEA14-like dessication related protein